MSADSGYIVLILGVFRHREYKVIALHVPEMHSGALQLMLKEQRAILFERVIDYIVDILMLDIPRNLYYLLETIDNIGSGKRRERYVRLIRRQLGHDKVGALHESDRYLVGRLHTDAEEIILRQHLAVAVEILVKILSQIREDVIRPFAVKNCLIYVDTKL